MDTIFAGGSSLLIACIGVLELKKIKIQLYAFQQCLPIQNTSMFLINMHAYQPQYKCTTTFTFTEHFITREVVLIKLIVHIIHINTWKENNIGKARGENVSDSDR